MGNASKEEAKELQAHLLQQLGLGTQVQVLAANRSERVERVVRVRGLVELRARNPRGDHSHAMLMTLLAGAVSLKQRVLLALVSEVLNQVAFAVLRTQLQLGYVVGASVSSISNVLTELNGAIELPCSCKVPYCQRCWDRTLATSLSNVGLPRCPSCREVIRVDYDASEGRLVFSRVADATVRFENWLETLDDILRQHSVQRCDEGFKFIARTQSGKLTKLFATWMNLDLGRGLDWFVLNHLGEEVHYPREPAEEEFPVQDQTTGVCLHPGDRILEVNGLQDVELIWEQLGCEELLKVRLQQQGSIFKTDVYNAQDDMRNRLQRQAKPRQQELLRRREHYTARDDTGFGISSFNIRQNTKE
eukprot:g31001.t1